MKNFSTIYGVFLALLISSIAIAQPANKDSSAAKYISNRTVNLMDNPNDYTGSPYHKKDFLKGSIIVEGKTIAFNQDLRYNVSKEEFEIKDPLNRKSKIVKTLRRNKNIRIKIGDNSYEYISSSKNGLRGYFIPLFKGDNNSLFKKVTKEYIPSQKAVNSMGSNIAAMYREKEVLYFVDGEGIFTELSTSKKGKRKALANFHKDVKTYIKKNKLNLNKKKDLIQVISYLDSL